uniref:Uncharacterized protein n=1 Tax=Oryza sativa subsp. japonica TaxID=39947 RepID=Q6ZLC9_ORYSJ|nr:hypothetical protein [Oryza sativa Japonica Group]
MTMANATLPPLPATVAVSTLPLKRSSQRGVGVEQLAGHGIRRRREGVGGGAVEGNHDDGRPNPAKTGGGGSGRGGSSGGCGIRDDDDDLDGDGIHDHNLLAATMAGGGGRPWPGWIQQALDGCDQVVADLARTSECRQCYYKTPDRLRLIGAAFPLHRSLSLAARLATADAQ